MMGATTVLFDALCNSWNLMQKMKSFPQMPDRENIERSWPQICEQFHRRKRSTALTDRTHRPRDEYLQAGWWEDEWLKFEAAGDVKALQKVRKACFEKIAASVNNTFHLVRRYSHTHPPLATSRTLLA
eukprot:1660317-Rhodomonas_salina.1